MSFCRCQQREEKGEKQLICSPLSLPSLVSLSVFYLANGGLHADWGWVALKPEQYCACGCVYSCVCVCVLILILQSSVIIPQQGLSMPSGHLSFPLLRFFFCFLAFHYMQTSERECLLHFHESKRDGGRKRRRKALSPRVAM